MKTERSESPNLGRLLLKCRAAEGLSTLDVAKALGVSPATISTFERGLSKMRRTTRMLLEDFLRKQGYLPKEGKAT